MERIKDIKKEWAEMPTPEIPNVSSRDLGQTSYIEKMYRRIKKHFFVNGILGLVIIFLTPILYRELHFSTLACVLYGVYGFAISVLCFALRCYLGRHNLWLLPVSRAIGFMIKLKRIVLISKTLSLLFGLFLVSLLLVEIYATRLSELFWAGVVGAVAGGIIGGVKCWFYYRTQSSLYRHLLALSANLNS